MSRAVQFAEHMLIELRRQGCFPTPLKLQYALLNACIAMAESGLDPGFDFTDDMRLFVQRDVYERFRHYRSNVITENVRPKVIDDSFMVFMAEEAQANGHRPAHHFIEDRSRNVTAYADAVEMIADEDRYREQSCVRRLFSYDRIR